MVYNSGVQYQRWNKPGSWDAGSIFFVTPPPPNMDPIEITTYSRSVQYGALQWNAVRSVYCCSRAVSCHKCCSLDRCQTRGLAILSLVKNHHHSICPTCFLKLPYMFRHTALLSMHCTALHSTALHCTTLPSTALCCAIIHCQQSKPTMGISRATKYSG